MPNADESRQDAADRHLAPQRDVDLAMMDATPGVFGELSARRSAMTGLRAALHADEPISPRLATFGRFIGSWRLEWERPGDPEAPTGVVGDLSFGWVLGGRAIQDVWIVPADGLPGSGQRPYAFHGSTIRFYDADLGAWRSTWIEPINGRVRTFIGREVDDEIHLISTDGVPFLRWRFTQITADSFIWLGEFSSDEVRNWTLEERMVATRAPAGPSAGRQSPGSERPA